MKLLYKTKIDFLQTLLLIADVLLVLIAFGIILFKQIINNVEKSNELIIFSSILITICIIQIIRIVKVFELYDEVMVLKRPLSFTSKTEIIIKIEDIKEIIFRKLKLNNGTVLIIDSKNLYETYTMNFVKIEIDSFENELIKLGVKTVRDNI